MRVHRPELVRIESAELTASINAAVFNPQLTNQPHDLLYVERTAASPNREHPKKTSPSSGIGTTIGVPFPNISSVPEFAALKPNPISSMRQQYHIERRLPLSLRSP